MTTLGSLVHANGTTGSQPLDIGSLILNVTVAVARHNLTASITPGHATAAVDLGNPPAVLAALTGWTNQDDDAHDMCSLVACRSPLHPGPCKGWKGLLHSVSPGTYHAVEAERVKKANERRVKRIADLKAQGKPIPRKLLEEIKPKPAPTGQHNAHGAAAVPLGQVNQKADLAGGQAHAAGAAINKAAGITPNTAKLPLGPKGKKPTVAGRGLAYVITQPKVTDTYKLDKAAKITPAEWDALSGTDKKAIRDELEAIKVRGFGPQQTKADQLLAKLPPQTSLGQGVMNALNKRSATPNAPGGKLTPGTPGTVTTPSGQVHQKINLPGKTSLGQATKTPASTPNAGVPNAAKSLPPTHAAALAVLKPGMTRDEWQAAGGHLNAIDALRRNGDVVEDGTKTVKVNGQDVTEKTYRPKGASGTPSPSSPAAPASSPGLKPSAPLPPGTAAHVQHAVAVANRTAPKASMGKTHVDAYGKLTKAEFDALPAAQQKTIRDDLANAKGKFLDPKKQQAAQDLLDRFGSRHPAPAAPGAPSAVTTMTPTNVAAAIRKNGSIDLILGGKKVTTGFAGSNHDGKLVMAPGGHYVVTTKDGTKHQLAKGQHVQVADSGPAAPGAPSGAKGYSDPVNEAVKAASTGTISTDDVLKTAGRLSPDSVKTLDDDDRKKILGRLAFVATHPKATPAQKAKAAAIGRMMNGGSPAQTSRKWDHTPTFDELHAEEQKSGVAVKAAAVDAANAKTGLAPGKQAVDRIAAMAALSKAQFDSLHADDQRKITDALHGLHTSTLANGSTNRDAAAGAAIEKLTGHEPGMHLLKQAEADFRSGKITADDLHQQMLHARVSTNNPLLFITGSPRALLGKEEERIARDNPSLPLWLRSEMIDNPYRTSAYEAIAQAGNKFNWENAPRLSSSDIRGIFKATDDELKSADPIHAEAVKALREHVLATGLRGQPGLKSGSPWSQATRNAAVEAFLGIGPGSRTGRSYEISDDRLKSFKSLPTGTQDLVRANLDEQILQAVGTHSKVRLYIALRQADGSPALNTDAERALMLAGEPTIRISSMDTYHKLSPADYSAFPNYVQSAIDEHLNSIDKQLKSSIGGMVDFKSGDDPLSLMPQALQAHLKGTRDATGNATVVDALDVVNYGTGLIRPQDRIAIYQNLPQARFSSLRPAEKTAIAADLDKMASDASNPLPIRYAATVTKDTQTGGLNSLTLDQLSAISSVNPAAPSADKAVENALTALTKGEFDSLAPVYREAVDDRIKSLPGATQQGLTAKFHPAAPQAANPSGYTPTTGASIPPHVQDAIDTIYGVHKSGKSHTMAHQLSVYGALRGSDFQQLNGQEQGHLLGDLSFIATTAKGPSADKARKLIDRFSPPGTPAGQVPTGAIVPPANAVAGQVRYANPIKGLAKAKDSGTSGDGWFMQGGQRVWGKHGAAGLLLQHTDPATGEKRYLMVQRGPAISDPGKWTFPGGASDSKETPHEGATRETIEELGLKDDVFKDALVHGDFTYSIPGSNWKYTSVAASVPTMIKPNLSTAHARAETSDAKWMTEAEIKALDAQGKLHHPIAGGKLEKNVISLFPASTATGGQKLGQIARPGPVTKRQGRLHMPSGGRVTPSTPPNAWPHAHKPSTGKNLVGDKAAIDAQRQKIKQDRKLYDGKTADGRLAAIGAQQGFDATPTVVDKKEIDRLLATGDYIEAWRGVSGFGGGWSARSRGSSTSKTAAEINEEMRTGPAYYGKGIFGNGYYLATDKSVAKQYSDHSNGSIVRMLIPKSAVMEKYDKVEREAQANSSRISKAKGSSGYEISTFWDPGRWGAAKGLDGIEINPHHRAHAGGGAGHVARPGKPAFNWLNRSVLIIQKEPG